MKWSAGSAEDRWCRTGQDEDATFAVIHAGEHGGGSILKSYTHSPEITYIITCKQCGKKFTSYGNRNRKYCSHKCYIYHRFYLEPEVTADVRSALEKKQLSELPEQLKAQVIRVLNESK